MEQKVIMDILWIILPLSLKKIDLLASLENLPPPQFYSPVHS